MPPYKRLKKILTFILCNVIDLHEERRRKGEKERREKTNETKSIQNK